ncbi:MAG: hypothetical protein PWP23_1303 [Candidatus Sumerlaeota bacterium]|nr:hypothetical protein [Candidatus Sumerlaeota bacterium]
MDWRNSPDPREAVNDWQRLHRMIRADWRRMETDEFLVEFALSIFCALLLFALIAGGMELGFVLYGL